MSDSPDTWITRRKALIAPAVALAAPLSLRGQTVGTNQVTSEPFGIGRDQPFDFDWKFSRGEADGLQALDFDDSRWRTLDLPHDWSIENLPPVDASARIGPFDPKSIGGTATGFTVGGEGWYRKHFRFNNLPASTQIKILFGGVYMDSDVWLNGHHLGRHVHGYTPFSYDLTPHLRQNNDNVLAVRVRNLGQNSRWYSGSGIYRSVTLDILPEAAQVARWGVAVATRRITGKAAEIEIETHLVQPASDLKLVSQVRSPTNAICAEISSPATELVKQSVTLDSVELWSPTTPAMYTLVTRLMRGKLKVDEVSTPFGVRIITFDADQGMQINGIPTKLRGGCVHHDNGLLGAAAYPDAEDRRVRLLKARGFNAIRSSHNPASRAFLDACDRHGMLVIEEAFDMWLWPKSPQDYSMYFADAWRSDLDAMICSARNHPSVVMWSIGNEIPNRSTQEGVRIQWNLANEVHRLDPTRPVTAAINGFAGRPLVADASTARRGRAGIADESAAIFLDVVGYNYKLSRYNADHARYPKRVIYGSESFPKDLFEIWSFIDANRYVVGDFVWSAMDYLGEAGIANASRNKSKISLPVPGAWPWVVSNAGDLDLTGRQKAPSRARDVAWEISPIEMAVLRPLSPGMFEHHTHWGWPDETQSWTWPGFEGQPLLVRVYTRADRLELHLNGKLAASMTPGNQTKLPLEFPIPYAAGTLDAVAYRDGIEIGRRRLETAGPAVEIRVIPEQGTGSSTRNRLCYVMLAIVDAEGRTVPSDHNKVHIDIAGPAKLAAFGGASPFASPGFHSPDTTTFDGHALLILTTEGRPGIVRLKASGNNLISGVTTIRLLRRHAHL